MTATSAGPVGRLDVLRSEVADFLAQEKAAGHFEPRCDSWLRSFDRVFSQSVGKRGWLGMTWPKAYGGADESHLARLVITEEFLRAGAPVAAHWIAERQIGPAILRYGDEALKAEFLPSIASGDTTFCLGMSESEAGSDLSAVRTVARPDAGGYRVSGTKIWTSNAHCADFAYVLACTDPDAPKSERLTELIVEMRQPGVEVRKIYDLRGEHHFNEVVFDGAVVPERWVIGEVGRGWDQVTAQLAYERGGPERFMSTYPLLEAVIAWAGRGAGDRATAERVGELVGRLRGLRALAWQVARRMDAGEVPTSSAAVLKFLGTRFEQDVVETARWLLEVEPDLEDSDIGGMLADAQCAIPGISLRGGATEILSGIIARGLTSGGK